MPGRPNLLIVVLDAQRASDFPGGSQAVEGMPFLRGLRRECWVFPRAVSPATWTIPSHASLFTGLYPWEHGTHGKGTLRLPSEVPTLSSMLGREGYRTGIFSANPFLGDDYGLARGFERAAWGSWWEHLLRWPSETPPFMKTQATAGARPVGRDISVDPLRRTLGPLLPRINHHLDRFPFMLDAGGRLALKVRRPATPWGLQISPWIEPTLERWISEGPAETPFFAVLNLLETHEPYFPDPTGLGGLADWWRALSVRQDGVSQFADRWRPSSEEMDRLHTMYRGMVRLMDRRLERVVEALRRSRKWDRTWLVITSDHGQGFGEEGNYFHFHGISEGLVRVPLWVRPADGTGDGRASRGLASLVDVAPTLLQAAGAPSTARFASAVDLGGLLDRDRDGPVYCVDDGLVWDHMFRWVRPSDRVEFDRARVAAYRGRLRVVVAEGGSAPQVDDVDRDPLHPASIRPGSEPMAGEMERAAREVLSRLTRSVSGAMGADERRLRSWGYV
ncbi:MAG: sulfatase [Euryarchaeota archaeon]|nr:sulfatase [Euryarchaeota archaeon]MDE1836409.1 sulfatase [Euryarchaeota archaeon]MDE1879076.1 sulfatase [Euryarchaeota archaeon]MDE2044157.1 sulfatase [Thermoplasmata archaeon]